MSDDREVVIPLPEGYSTGIGEWGRLFATVLNKRSGLATQAEVDEQIAAILDRIQRDTLAPKGGAS